MALTRKLKAGVKVVGLAPEMLIADAVVEGVYTELGADELIITSIGDGTHGKDSLHTRDPVRVRAIDYRRWSLIIPALGPLPEKDNAPEAARMIAHRLRGQFDVVLEDTHLHVEFDPKD